MKEEHINEIKAIIVLALGMILFASLISFTPNDLSWYTSEPNIPAKNLIRISGAYIAGSILFVCGYSAYALVLFLLFWSWNKFTSRDIHFTLSKFLSFIVLFGVISSMISLYGSQDGIDRFQRAGLIGVLVSDFLYQYLGSVGTYIVLFTLGSLALILTGEVLVTPFFLRLYNNFIAFFESMKAGLREGSFSIAAFKPSLKMNQAPIQKKQISPKKVNLPVADDEDEYEEESEIEEDENDEFEEDELEEDEEYEDDEEPEFTATEKETKPKKPLIRIAQPTDEKAEHEEGPQIVGEFTLPSLDLLQDAPKVSTNKIQNNLINDATRVEETLASFGVGARVVDIERGPAITRYELEPGAGVKVQKFTTLSNDIALAMKAPTVRIVAPIPGKSRVGIEVPNDSSASVYLKDVLSSPEFRNSGSKLTIALGKDIAGKSMVADLAEMPHLMIAGTTGSGKSVCVNGIIMSILLNASPDEVRFVMVDPKMVELAQYNDIPHLLAPTVTDPKKAAAVLNWVVGEMESRYKRLSKAGAKNIKGYNEKGHHMYYIVVIIDELADLMQVSAKGVEGSITRLAQLSRAVGIHLILATQRPSVNVITGVIKANFPARISFKVASKVDSRTVLDMNGAESLLGKGDMLFLKPGDAKPTRGQGNFVKDEEINKVIQFIKDQQAPSYDENILNSHKPGAVGGDGEEKDEYYDQAVQLVIETNQASVSILQRRMRLGYTRAARLIDMMEQAGIVGPYCGSKPREILIDREQWLLENMQGDNNE